MENQKLIDHLFRHQFGKMVSVLTRIFGLTHLETIEDAVQDTFVRAMLSWRQNIPDNPEGWLMQAAKNRAIDLFRKLTAEQKRVPKLESGPASMSIYDMFLDHEIQDSQLRMIFTACHPFLNPQEQISFALKTISGFSIKEIASALLLNEETIKKRLVRARKSIKEKSVSFEIPMGTALPGRLSRVMEVLYLIFNEGFHSNKKNILVRNDLCGEAARLCQMLLQNENTKQPSVYALFALMCFQAARLKSKTNDQNEVVDLKNQDRSKWNGTLMAVGNDAMIKAVETDTFSSYHFEAAIAAEHLMAKDFESTNWDKILSYYEKLNTIQSTPINLLNMVIIQLQRNELEVANALLQKINPKELKQRAYLFYGTYAEYFIKKGDSKNAILNFEKALEQVNNESERAYILKKKDALKN